MGHHQHAPSWNASNSPMGPETAISLLAFQKRIIIMLLEFLEVWISYRKDSVASVMVSLVVQTNRLSTQGLCTLISKLVTCRHTILMKINPPLILQFSSFASHLKLKDLRASWWGKVLYLHTVCFSCFFEIQAYSDRKQMFLFDYNMHHLHMDSHYLHRYIQWDLGFKNMIKTNIILIPEVGVYFCS